MSPYISQMLTSANPVAYLGIGGGYDTNIIICPELKSNTVKKLCSLLTTGVTDLTDSLAVAELVDSAKLLGISLNNVSLEPLEVVTVESSLEQGLANEDDNHPESDIDFQDGSSETNSFDDFASKEEDFGDDSSLKAILDDHFKKLESKRPETANCCPICRKPFLKKYNVLEHLAQKHFRKELLALVDCNKKPYTCFKCDKYFDNDVTYARHLGTTHKMLSKVLPTDLQDFEINLNKNIGKLQDHAPNQCLKRGHCDKIEDQVDSKKVKEFNDNSDEDKENKDNDSDYEGSKETNSKACPICKNEYSHISSVMTHLALDHFRQELQTHVDENDPSQCIDCGVRIPNSNYMIKHLGCTHKRLLDVMPGELMIELRKLYGCKERARSWKGLW